MHTFQYLVTAVVVIVLIYALAFLLRRRGTLHEDHALTLARLVTDLCLPAMIFVNLASQTIRLDQVVPALVMLALELFCIALAWAISALLKFGRAQQGAIVFCSAFGSSTFLGYSIITQVFPHSPEALSEAVLISEIGVGYPIFILGPILAAYFGSAVSQAESPWKASLGFFRSPVFFALIAGILWGVLRLPGETSALLAPVFRLGNILAAAVTPLAVLSVALMFTWPDWRTALAPLAIVVLLKLILKPVLAGFLAAGFAFPELWKEVLVLLAAMPPAVLGAVFLRRYGGDAKLASTLLLAASVVSCLTIIGVFWLMG